MWPIAMWCLWYWILYLCLISEGFAGRYYETVKTPGGHLVSETYQWVVEAAEAGWRLDLWVSEKLPQVTRRGTNLLDEGLVLVNQKRLKPGIS